MDSYEIDFPGERALVVLLPREIALGAHDLGDVPAVRGLGRPAGRLEEHVVREFDPQVAVEEEQVVRHAFGEHAEPRLAAARVRLRAQNARVVLEVAQLRLGLVERLQGFFQGLGSLRRHGQSPPARAASGCSAFRGSSARTPREASMLPICTASIGRLK